MSKITALNDAETAFSHFLLEVGAVPLVQKSAKHVPVKEAKAKLTELLRIAESGERIVLTRNGKPVADLVPHEGATELDRMSILDRVQAWHTSNPAKAIGWVSDDFDDPLPEDFLLKPFPEDFDDRFAAAQKRARESHAQ